MRATCVLALTVVATACNPDPGAGATATGSTDTDTSTSTGTSTGAEPTTTTTTTGEPVCCGCLCLDPGWSCTIETCLMPDGTAVGLGPEAGFLAVPPHEFSYLVDGDPRQEVVVAVPEARMWYVFQPAAEAPETRPLMLFFNGGPVVSTAILLGSNTGPRTADPDVAGAERVVDNPHAWTRSFNLLYVDAHEAGYSYDIAPAEGPAPQPVPFVPEQDAAYFVRTLLAFLARHPQIEDNPVIVVGESYGGTRAAIIAELLLRSEALVGSGLYRNAALRAAIVEHFARTRPEVEALDAATVASQFGAQVLIQPSIYRALPWPTPDEQARALLGCVDGGDSLQCDEPSGWWQERGEALTATMTDPASLAALTGVDVTTIAWLHADARTKVYPRGPAMIDLAPLEAVFGALSDGDVHYASPFMRMPVPGLPYAYPAARYGRMFVAALPLVRTFITHAGKDATVYAPDIPAVLAGIPELVTSSVHETEGPETRPGRIVVTYAPAAGVAAPVQIRFPYYEDAGHAVTMRRTAELLEDVEAWLAGG